MLGIQTWMPTSVTCVVKDEMWTSNHLSRTIPTCGEQYVQRDRNPWVRVLVGGLHTFLTCCFLYVVVCIFLFDVITGGRELL